MHSGWQIYPPPSELKTLLSKELGTMVIGAGEGTGCNVAGAEQAVMSLVKEQAVMSMLRSQAVLSFVWYHQALTLKLHGTLSRLWGYSWHGTLSRLWGDRQEDWESLEARSTPLKLVAIGIHLAQLQHGGWWYFARAYFLAPEPTDLSWNDSVL